MKDLKGIIVLLPVAGALYAIYEAYGQRGLSGFLVDLKALPGILKNRDALEQLAIGLVIIIGGGYLINWLFPKTGKWGWLRHAGYATVYYFGVQQIASAIRSGAAASGRGYQGNPGNSVMRRR